MRKRSDNAQVERIDTHPITDKGAKNMVINGIAVLIPDGGVNLSRLHREPPGIGKMLSELARGAESRRQSRIMHQRRLHEKYGLEMKSEDDELF